MRRCADLEAGARILWKPLNSHYSPMMEATVVEWSRAGRVCLKGEGGTQWLDVVECDRAVVVEVLAPAPPPAPATGPNRHPIQPLHIDTEGVLRFRANAIVKYLLDSGCTDMNKLAAMPFSKEDRAQFAQLIGYSASGWQELHYTEWDTAADEYIDSFHKEHP